MSLRACEPLALAFPPVKPIRMVINGRTLVGRSPNLNTICQLTVSLSESLHDLSLLMLLNQLELIV